MTLSSTLADIEKKHGKGTVWKMGDRAIEDIDVIPTGNLAIDVALGVGGYARGRIVEIYGPESSGKTTLTLHAVAEAQKLGGVCVFIDAEHALDPVYARAIGVDIDSLYICQPDNGEQALEVAADFIKSGEVALVVIDSVSALVPRAEIAGDIGDSHVGLQARLMSQAMRIIAGAANRSNTTVIFINQLREKIGVMFGSPETTSGGRALKFYASQRIDIRRVGAVKIGTDIVGNETKVKIVKNKVAPPFVEARFDITYGEGMSQAGTLIDFGVDYGIVKKSGAWYTDWNGEQMGQGREAAKALLNENPDMMIELYALVMQAIYGDDEDVEGGDGN